MRAGKHGELGPNWKGDAAGIAAGHARARLVVPLLGLCEGCGDQATDRHHKDENVLNNDPSNIATLCRRCHMLTDGRLERFRELGRQVNAKAVANSLAVRTSTTHCKNGHEWSGYNLRVTRQGWRRCRTCYREWMRAKRASLK